jgi:hypothetical protein
MRYRADKIAFLADISISRGVCGKNGFTCGYNEISCGNNHCSCGYIKFGEGVADKSVLRADILWVRADKIAFLTDISISEKGLWLYKNA